MVVTKENIIYLVVCVVEMYGAANLSPIQEIFSSSNPEDAPKALTIAGWSPETSDKNPTLTIQKYLGPINFCWMLQDVRKLRCRIALYISSTVYIYIYNLFCTMFKNNQKREIQILKTIVELVYG
jgi:hypothetical protein